jgi:hypothetical protein
VSGITTLRASISSVHFKPPHGARAELDSHADTCSFGNKAYIVHDTGDTISVTGFIDLLGTVKKVPIVTAAVAYDDPDTYTTYILFFHQSLYFNKLDKHLLCPSQMQCNQIIVNDVPLLHIPFNKRTHQDHSIVSTPTTHSPTP